MLDNCSYGSKQLLTLSLGISVHKSVHNIGYICGVNIFYCNILQWDWTHLLKT